MTNGKHQAFPSTIPSIKDQIADALGSASAPSFRAGLSKRELFAAMAMQGLAASTSAWEQMTIPEQAKNAVLRADALLEELAKTEEKPHEPH